MSSLLSRVACSSVFVAGGRRGRRTPASLRTPFRAGVGGVVLAALAVGLLPAEAAAAAPPQWRDALAAAATPRPTDGATYLKWAIVDPPAAVDSALVAAVRSDIETRYADEDRPRHAQAAAAVFGTDHRVAVEVQTALNKQYDADLVRVAARLLAADRRTADALLRDARLVTATGGKGKDSADVTKVERAIAAGDDSWSRGQPVAAVQHFEQATGTGFDLLTRHGVSYARDADLDGDGAADLLELRFGADPRVRDTDGDGLTDAFEIERAFPFHSPSVADTDSNGRADGAEDQDGDGASAAEEQTAGTKPLSPDTDEDTLPDGAEIAGSTSPTASDSDDDGLADAAEVRAGTDPRDRDSDDDGVLDGADVLRGTFTGPGGEKVVVHGVGDIAGGFTVTSFAGDPVLDGAPGQVSDPIDITLDPAFADDLVSAELTLPYDPAAAPGEAPDLRVFLFDEDHHAWLPVDGAQQVDRVAHTVRAAVPHFSIYAVFDFDKWRQFLAGLTEDTCSPALDSVPMDVVLAVDNSSEMNWNLAQPTAKNLLYGYADIRPANTRAAVVEYRFSYARVRTLLTSSTPAIKEAIRNIVVPHNWGSFNRVVSRSLLVLNTYEEDPAPRQAIVLVTNGVHGGYLIATNEAKAAGVPLIVVNVGQPDVDTEWSRTTLREMATATGGAYIEVRYDQVAAGIIALSSALAEVRAAGPSAGGGDTPTTDSTADSDGDGLTDCAEERGMRDSAGYLTFTSDPRLPDTDGDGLPDGVEIGDEITLTLPGVPIKTDLYPVFSDPRKADTDDDDILFGQEFGDADEFEAGSRARSNDTDGDGADDQMEVANGTHPDSPDTDRDGLGDAQEILSLNERLALDPVQADEIITYGDWTHLYWRGVYCGDWCEADNVPQLIGTIAGSFNPLADARDLLAGIAHTDPVGIGFSALGFIPIGGDGAKAWRKITEFAGRYSDKVDDLLQAVCSSDKVGVAWKGVVLRLLRPHSITTLAGHGFTDEALVVFARGRLDLRHLADTVRRSAGIPLKSPEHFFFGWRKGEEWLRNAYPGSLPKGRGFANPASGGRRNYRIVDAWDPTELAARESKVGYQKVDDRILRQIEKDKALLDADKFAKVEWHFFPSALSNKVGADKEIIDKLVANNIPFFIHAAAP